MLEGVVGAAVGALVAGVVGVHEDVRAGLELVVDAARGLELEGAGAGAADDVAREAGGASALARSPRVRSIASSIAARRSSMVRMCWARPW